MLKFAFEDVRLVEEPFSPQETLEWTADVTITKGGVASFTGYVSAGNGVEALQVLHYEPLTLPGMQDLAIAAQHRFDIIAIAIVQRIGVMLPKEAIVCVAAAARHRRDAIEAVDFTMDHLKSASWFWKRERRTDGWHWIEPRDADHADLSRWG